MKYRLEKYEATPKKEKFGIKLAVYPNVDNCGVVKVSTRTGHNQEFYDIESKFTYIVLEGDGSFFLDNEEVVVTKGDFLSIQPNTRIYYKGEMELFLITTPAWKPENEIETRPNIW